MEAPHEHMWRYAVSFRTSRLNDDGFVIDFVPVQAAVEELSAQMEGRDLNELIGEAFGASAERVAQHLAVWLGQRLGRQAYSVRITEAPGCQAAYYSGDTT
jgi:6-pyruvoyl-tetrahydropterin synthase